MKKSRIFIMLAGFLAMSLVFLYSCGEASKEHATDAKENIEEAGKDLKEAAKSANEEARLKATADWQQFKNESDSTIAVMEKQIVTLKEKIAKADKNIKDKLTNDLNKAEEKLIEQKDKLKKQSIEFEEDLKKFDESVVARNESFRREFNHDMVELGNALQNMVKDNVK